MKTNSLMILPSIYGLANEVLLRGESISMSMIKLIEEFLQAQLSWFSLLYIFHTIPASFQDQFSPLQWHPSLKQSEVPKFNSTELRT